MLWLIQMSVAHQNWRSSKEKFHVRFGSVHSIFQDLHILVHKPSCFYVIFLLTSMWFVIQQDRINVDEFKEPIEYYKVEHFF